MNIVGKMGRTIIATALLAATLTASDGIEPASAATTQGQTNQVAQKLSASDAQKLKEFMEFQEAAKKYAKELTVSKDRPYKEIKLDNGYILFASVKETQAPAQQTVGISSYSGSSVVRSAYWDVYSNYITSTYGYKNLFGMVLFSIETSTSWSYDLAAVLDGYTGVTPYVRGGGWQITNSYVSGPYKMSSWMWSWTATGIFSYNVAGINFATKTLNTRHTVYQNGNYEVSHWTN